MIFAYIGCGFGFLVPNMASIAASTEMAVGVSPVISTIVTLALFVFIVVGGVKRISSFTDKAVPFMAFAFHIRYSL